MKTQNILWDLDGTLFDTYPAITYALSKSLNGMGISVPLNMIDALARQSLSHCVDTLAGRFKLDPELLGDKFTESYRAVDPANQPPFPGARDVCAWIHEHGGRNLIITHRGLRSAQRFVEMHDMVHYFDDIFSVEQGYPRKPDPALMVAAIEKYSLDPAGCLVIGDRELEIEAGRAAGMRSCLFGAVELTHPTDLQIHFYNELLDYLMREAEGTNP